MEKGKMKTKKGAASFYIVAFSTLILVIIAASFTAVVLSELARTANDDLSQSAYDSALAGIEDAKLAYYNYLQCLNKGASALVPTPDSKVECGEIIYWVENADCDMVAKILGRIGENDNKEVMIEESTGTSGKNNMQQAYTCVKFSKKLRDYRSTLTEADSTKVVRVRLGDGISANDIERVKISWFSEDDRSSTGKFEPRFSNVSGNGIKFPALKNSDTDVAVPPMISVGLVQTAEEFSVDQFETTTSSGTNRATVFLVPTGTGNLLTERSKDTAEKNDYFGNYISAYGSGASKDDIVSKSILIKSNDRKVKNLPIAVYCDTESSEFACSAMLELPNVIASDTSSKRSDDTFMFVVSLPYGQPNASFSLEFYCKASVACGKEVVVSDSGETEQQPATLEAMQIAIDSTGRANNLYRRVQVRLDSEDMYFPYPLYALELLGGSGDTLLDKNMNVTCEWEEDFGGPTC